MEKQLFSKLIKIPVILVFAVVLIVYSCNNGKTVKNSQAVNGLRIVSLAPSISKELCYLGVKDNIVGATSYCDISKENEKLIVGSAIDINVEKILLLKPDVVFATGLTKVSNIESLKENGIQVYEMGKMNSYKAICDEFLVIGKLVNKEAEAVEIIAHSKQIIDSLKSSILDSEKQKVFFQIGAKPLFAVIPNTFMDDLITFAGCKNLAFDLEHGTMTRESVLNRNPDVIYVATMGIVGEEEKNIWEGYQEINAVKNNKVFVIDSNMACTPSVISFTESLTQMIQEIYN